MSDFKRSHIRYGHLLPDYEGSESTIKLPFFCRGHNIDSIALQSYNIRRLESDQILEIDNLRDGIFF